MGGAVKVMEARKQIRQLAIRHRHACAGWSAARRNSSAPRARCVIGDIERATRLDMMVAYFSPRWGLIGRIGAVAKRGEKRACCSPPSPTMPRPSAPPARSYGGMLKKGVKIYEFEPAKLHAKLIVVDDATYIGSANFDMRISVTKAFTNLLVLRAVEHGHFQLTTPITALIPEFTGRGREKIPIWHLLSHQAGFPMLFEVQPGWYIDNFAEVTRIVIEEVAPVDAALRQGGLFAAGQLCADGRGGAAHGSGETPIPADRAGRHPGSAGHARYIGGIACRSQAPQGRPGLPQQLSHRPREPQHAWPNGAFEDEEGEMPWVGIVSTTPDLFRFADVSRTGGKANGARLVSPAMIDLATRNWTGEMVNELYAARGHEEGIDPAPAYIGLGFSLRGTALCPHMFGTLASPRSFGNYGAGTSLFWVDPERDITFACLTAGVMGHNANMRRFQKIADMVISAAD